MVCSPCVDVDVLGSGAGYSRRIGSFCGKGCVLSFLGCRQYVDEAWHAAHHPEQGHAQPENRSERGRGCCCVAGASRPRGVSIDVIQRLHVTSVHRPPNQVWSGLTRS